MKEKRREIGRGRGGQGEREREMERERGKILFSQTFIT